MTSRRRLLALAAAAAATCLLAACERRAPAHKFNAIDLTGASYARTLSLPDADGKPRTLADFKGKLVLVFFGYTQCPDACPTTMAELTGILKSMPAADAARVQVVFVTVDPARDSPTLLRNYVTNFRPDFIALRGDEAQTQAVIKEFKVLVQQVPGRTPDTYTIDHTAGVYVFDGEGRVRLFASQSLEPEKLTQDLKALLAGA